MQKVFLHFRLLAMLSVAFSYFIFRELQHCLLCIVSYQKSIARIDMYLYRQARIFCNLAEFIFGIRFFIPVLDEYKRVLDKPCIVISNHQSLMDIMILIAAFPVPIRFVSKKILGRFVPYISKVIRAYNSALIDRKSGMKTIQAVQDLARRCRRNVTPMIIFPEGTRTRSGDVQKFHNAAVRAAVMDGPMNIFVVALDGGLFFPKLFGFPSTKNKRYMYLKILKIFEDVDRRSVKGCVEKSEELIRNYVVAWRRKHDVHTPMTEYTQRRQRSLSS